MAQHAVFGIFPTRQSTEAVLERLKDAGYRPSDISILAPENLGELKDMATIKETKAPEGTAVGATSGAVLGGILGGLASVGLLAIPGIGPLLAAGPIVGVLTGMGLLGAAGGIVGALTGMGIPEYEAKSYEGRLSKGGILVSIHADNEQWVKRAKEILHTAGGEGISETTIKHAA